MTLWGLRKKQLNFNNMSIFQKNYKLLLFFGSIFKLTNFKSKPNSLIIKRVTIVIKTMKLYYR